MFDKVLVANRGEIALRVIRACRELGLRTVAVYSEADENALHVRFADEAICVGPAPASQSYLHIRNVISAALISGAGAIHPGYGFLAENLAFANAVRSHGLVFVGPRPQDLQTFGDKLSAREAARQAGVPLVPGSKGALASAEAALRVARRIGYPVLIKAAMGGGGKGMRVAADARTLRRVFEITSAEAEAAFGSGAVYLERFLPAPRHIEVQLVADNFGQVIHVGERDCSLQRRHQKLVEEATAPGLSSDLRARIQTAAVRLAQTSGYQNIGTCEFLVEGDEFFFLEVNPRVQVEHAVTEEVSGLDLVQLQLRLAAGEPCPIRQQDVHFRGHAIEIRVNAEDPWTFLPSPGVVTGYHVPGGPGVRIDSAVHEGAVVQPYYDSLIGKLIVHADTRPQAIEKALWAMDEFVVEGIRTTLPLQRALLAGDDFRRSRVHTRYVDEWLAARIPRDV